MAFRLTDLPHSKPAFGACRLSDSGSGSKMEQPKLFAILSVSRACSIMLNAGGLKVEEVPAEPLALQDL